MDRIKKLFYTLEKSLLVEAIRNGLIMIMPIILIGSFSLIFKSLPINGYQDFIKTWLDGALNTILQLIYNATFGLLSIYMAFSISLNYVRVHNFRNSYVFGGAITAVAGFFILSGTNIDQQTMEYFGAKGMFTAIFSALVIAKLYSIIVSRINLPVKLYADGIDVNFNDSIFVTVPAIIILSLVAIINYAVCSLCHVGSFHELYVELINSFFDLLGRTFSGGLVFVTLSSVLWFLGIHGSDVLEGVSQNFFNPALAENIQQVALGNQPTEIFTKQFFDLFILLGGCGTSLALLVSILLFSKRKINRNLAKMAIFPGIFNINEILVFGLPVIYNPYMLIPFIATPIVLFFTSYIAFVTGIVPLVTTEVAWTTPIIFSGYISTGSVAGSILQIVNLCIGILIYIPFVRMYDGTKSGEAERRMEELMTVLKESEENNENICLTNLPGMSGNIAKSLAVELKEAIGKKEIEMYYQPQFNYEGVCIGAEALLRYNHPLYGMLYPPLVIKIAQELGILYKLETLIFEKVSEDMKLLDVSISVNVTATTIAEERFVEFLANLKKKYEIADGKLCIEITEQTAMSMDMDFIEKLNAIKEMGYLLAIDDFTMGHTSVKYLQSNNFDRVKLDGSIVKDMMVNPRSREIISSIIYLSESLDFKVIAEFVESEDQIDGLRRIGCHYYQGYYFGKADKLAKLINQL